MLRSPVAVQEYDGGGQAAPVVDDELEVGHRLVAFVHQRAMLSTRCLVPVVNLVYHVGDLRQVDVQPRCVLRATTAPFHKQKKLVKKTKRGLIAAPQDVQHDKVTLQ